MPRAGPVCGLGIVAIVMGVWVLIPFVGMFFGLIVVTTVFWFVAIGVTSVSS